MNKKERQIIFDKTNGRCSYCGCKLTKGWHVDHLLPIRRKQKYMGGKFMNIKDGEKAKWVDGKWVNDGMEHPERDIIENKIPACASCNINKHGMSVDEYREAIYKFVESLNEGIVQYRIAKRFGLIEETGNKITFYFETLK